MIFRSIYSKPILLLGNGVRASGAVELAHDFIRRTYIPALTTMNGVDIVQDDMHIGFIGTHGNRIANMILDECDLVVAVGARLGIRQVGNKPTRFAPKADLIRADIDENELSRDIKTNEKKFHMDARDFIRKISDETSEDFSSWNKKCFEAKSYLEDFDIQTGNRAVMKISSLLPKDPIVAVDVGMNQCWCAQSLHLKGTRGRIHISGGFGAMGFALPCAIGASVSNGGGTVYCICGDGGFQMNIQELETVRRESLPIKIIVLNNRVLGKISETQHFNYNDRFANTAASGGYTVPDFEKIACSYGIKAATLPSYESLDEYADWFYDSEPCLINILLPEASFLTPKIKFETGVITPVLESDVFHHVSQILRS